MSEENKAETRRIIGEVLTKGTRTC